MSELWEKAEQQQQKEINTIKHPRKLGKRFRQLSFKCQIKLHFKYFKPSITVAGVMNKKYTWGFIARVTDCLYISWQKRF